MITLADLCDKKKMGEYNMLVCCLPKGHKGNCNFIVERPAVLKTEEKKKKK